MKKTLYMLFALLLCSTPFALAEMPMGEGYIVQDNALNIHLWAGANTGFVWTFELGDDELIALRSEKTDDPVADSPDGASAMCTWVFAPKADGEALISFSYGDPDQQYLPQRTLCYTVNIDGGQITSVDLEDLSEDHNNSGDDDSVVTYDGETGGVLLNVPEGMVETETDEGTLLTSEDGTRTILIDYQPGDSPAELFDQLKDAESAAAIYEDEGSDEKVMSSMVDPDSDPPSATLVLSTPDGYSVYTGYQAPDGGVLHVHTTYTFAEGE